MKTALLILLCAVSVFAAAPQLPPPTVQDFPSRLHIVRRSTLVDTNRLRCTTNCPPAKTNVVFSWKPERGLAWDASVSSGITNYRIYYGKGSQLTNSFNAGSTRTNWLTNCPPGAWDVAVTAINTAGLESDLSATLRITNDTWRVEDWTALKSASMTFTTTTNLYSVFAVGGSRFVRVRADRAGSAYVGVRVQ